jgi:hypothetical protein
MHQAKDDLVRDQQSRDEPNDTLKAQGAVRVLIAGEFANDWGHLGCMLAMARAYRAAGHEVILAVSDLNAARFFFAADDFLLLQAPVLRITQHRAPHQGTALNFADLLWGLGYADSNALAMAADAWITLLTEIDPALLVYINAPTAVLAARVLGTPTIFVGGAFDIPPATHPLPIFRPVADLPEQKLAVTREAEVVENINSILGRFQQPAIGFLREFFPAERAKLTTLPELDAFGPRGAEQYVGPVFALPAAYRVSWKDTQTGTRIFAYLHPQAPACESVLQVLNSLEAEVLCVMPGCPSHWSARFDRIAFHTQPLELAFILPFAHLVITDGVATTTTALLAGRPILSVPRTLEQHTVAHALERSGAVKVVDGSASVERIAEDISELLGYPKYRQAAMWIAAKYMKVKFANNAQRILEDMML